MPATPAWPPESAPRLFIDRPLSLGQDVAVSGAQAHYLVAVMRIRPGGCVRLFDDRGGEWAAEATTVGKRDLTLRLTDHLRDREAVPDLWLCIAPIKRGRIDWVAEKATELGVDRVIPVTTRRSVVDRLNAERLRAHMIEAAEQCDRTALPRLDPLTSLAALLADWPAGRTLYFADETGGAAFADVIRPGPAAILVGPEGGFDPAERAAIRAVPQAVPVSLGPRILRAETAAIAGTALWMALAGDWSVAE